MKHSLSILLVGLTAGGLFGTRPLPAQAAEAQEAMVKTEAVSRQDFERTCRWFGRVVSPEQLPVQARIDGRIVALHVVDAQPVQRGDLLFTLGGPELEAQVDALRVSLEGLKEQQADAEQVLALKRQALADKLTGRQEVAVAERTLSELATRIQLAEQGLHRLDRAAHVRAPKAGLLSARRVTPGQDVARGEVLAELVPTNDLRIVATLFPPPGSKLDGKSARVHVGAGRTVPATVTHVLSSRTAEGATTVWMEGEAVSRELRPGETVGGVIVLEQHAAALAVPRAAVVRDATEQPCLFLQIAGGYGKRNIETGLERGDWVEVLSGIKEGEQVVTRGAYELLHRNFSKTFKVVD